jgi:hypothetical protein
VAQIEYALLADHVRQEGGLAHILAANINTLVVEEVPAPWNLGILIVVRQEDEQPGDTSAIRILFRTESGTELVQIDATLTLNPSPDHPDDWPRFAMFALNFGIVVPEHGNYAFDLSIDGATQRTLNVRVIRPQVQTDASA